MVIMEVGSQVRVRSLGIDRRLAESVENLLGIDSLYPPQEEALRHGLTGKNLMLSIPTASGKSLVAHICMLQKVISSDGGRGIYVVPLKALASEKHEEIQALCEGVGLKASLALGDRGEEMGSLHDWDILVCTSERLDSLIRTRPNFLDNVEAIVIDEFHLLDDPGRGPTLEIIIARIKHERPGCQIIALSATVGNSDSVANWLKANLVKSEWRPVELQSGTVNGLGLKIHRIDGMIERDLPSPREISGNPNQNLRALVLDAMETGGQTLIFVNSRASAQKEARELSKHIKRISEREGNEDIRSQIENWENISKSIAGASEGTTMSKALAESVSRGIGFHHAGLSSRQRRIIEDSFRMGNLTALVATPTLAQGVNLPSRRVVIRDHRRWNSAAGGSMPIRAIEVRQMLGRAGRPGYDPHGEGMILAKNSDEEQFIVDRYLLGEIEPIVSKLANPNSSIAEEDPALLTHLLALIATGGLNDRFALGSFLAQTFLADSLDNEEMESRIDRSIAWLADNGMIERAGEDRKVAERISEIEYSEESEEDWGDDLPDWAKVAGGLVRVENIQREALERRVISPRKGPAVFGFSRASDVERAVPESPESLSMTYRATGLGRTVARLYLNPISGRIISDGLSRAGAILSGVDDVGQITPFSLIHLAISTPDFQKLWVKRSELEDMEIRSSIHDRERLISLDVTEELERVKSTSMLLDWIEERSMGELESSWGVQPGDIRSRVDGVEWLLRSSIRILAESSENIVDSGSIADSLTELLGEIQIRIRHGCRSDIIPLVSIRGVGRSRARDMIEKLSLESVSDVASMTDSDINKLSTLQGWSVKLATNIRKEASSKIKGMSGKA
ncbi:MAG: hypothetical protein CMB07_06175 [Euryarchaeota archaeon]|nr:hypothetical protein [Euryarchaeota archaeon]